MSFQPSTIYKPGFNSNLETLRGVAAILVVWGHSTIKNGWIDPRYYLTGIWSYAGPGSLSVLVFFLLSGYVIGIAHLNPLVKSTIGIYLKKRFIRIYPIYFICLVLALLISKIFNGQTYTVPTIASHLVMTQGWLAPTINAIAPAWSLTYESAFYLLFIPISFFKIKPIIVALISFSVGCTTACLYPTSTPPQFISFTFGFTFWLSGLALADNLSKKRSVVSYASMASFLFLFLAIGKLDASSTLFHRFSLELFGKQISDLLNSQGVTFHDFGYLPYCIVILVLFTSKQIKYHTAIMVILLTLPSVTYYYYYKHFDVNTVPSLVLPTIFYAISITSYVFSDSIEKTALRIIKLLTATGGISYGLYIIHFPILYVFGHVFWGSGSSSTFTIRLICFVLLSISGAYILEKKIQPWTRTLLM